ncbi:MAG: PAS domain S-box protein [Haloglomus sp.]
MADAGDWNGDRAGGDDAPHSDGSEPLETDAVADLGVDFAFRLAPDGTVEAVSGDVERLVGVPAAAAVGDSFEAYVADRYLETAHEALEAILAGETVRGMALRLTSEGNPWIEMNAEPVRADDAGDDSDDAEVVAVRGAAREATERRRTIERRAEAMGGAMDGMALLDEEGHYLFVNEAHAALYGYDREELIGSHWSRLYEEDECRRLETAALPVMEQLGSWRGTAVGRRADGSTFQQELSLSALDEGFVCVVRDVTDRHQREQIIDVLDRVLRHNLRNEMNVVMGEARDIARATDAEAIEAAARRITERAECLLATSDTARTVREVVTGEHEESVTDLNRVVEGVRQHAPADANRIATCLPDSPTLVDCPGIARAVLELVENALEHGTVEESVRTQFDQDDESDSNDRLDGPLAEPTVRIELSRTEDEAGAPIAVLRVVDRGPGIPQMEQITLEAGSETPLRHGQGLGLWLVKWVAAEAGGDFAVHERDEGGTVGELRLPLVDAKNEHERE